MGSQRVRHDWVTEHTRWIYFFCFGFDIFDGIFVLGPFSTSLKNNLTLLSGNIVTFIFNVIWLQYNPTKCGGLYLPCLRLKEPIWKFQPIWKFRFSPIRESSQSYVCPHLYFTSFHLEHLEFFFFFLSSIYLKISFLSLSVCIVIW